MGKNGDKLRALKAQKTYSLTEEQILTIKKNAVEEYKERYRQECEGLIKREFEKQKRDCILETMSMVAHLSCKILVKNFGWRSCNESENPEKLRLGRFVNRIYDEYISLENDFNADMKAYIADAQDIIGFEIGTIESD